MKRAVSFVFIFLLISPYVFAASYTLPGQTSDGKPYNNIGILGEVAVSLNVTLVNTASFPKFVIVNPRYDFTVLRRGGETGVYSENKGGSVSHVVSDLGRNILNYYVGFWIMPYETVVVNFEITFNNSYVIKTFDFSSICGDSAKIKSVAYDNGVSGVILPLDDPSVLTCGVMYPPLVNTPEVINPESMFPLLDKHIKVLGYSGKVVFRLTNVPNNGDGPFWVYFATAVPVIFKGAQVYNFTPNYTMNYSEYMRVLLGDYIGLDYTKTKTDGNSRDSDNGVSSGMFQLSDTLLTGVSIRTSVEVPKKKFDFDFPVWIVFMKNRVEISYFVRWSPGGESS